MLVPTASLIASATTRQSGQCMFLALLKEAGGRVDETESYILPRYMARCCSLCIECGMRLLGRLTWELKTITTYVGIYGEKR